MGAVDYLPYAHANSDGVVAIWDGAHAIVDHTTGANVTCMLQRPNGLWYKLASRYDLHADEPGRSQVPTEGRYFSAALTTLLSVPPGYAWGVCQSNTDQPGRRHWPWGVLVSATLAALASLVVARRISRPR